jgi:hypothetical protein
MLGFPPDFDYTVFQHLEFLSLTYASNMIDLNFGNQITISVFGSISFSMDGDDDVVTESLPLSQSRLMHLLDRIVERAELKTQRELTIHFTTGESIQLIDDSDSYESFILRVGSNEIVV